MNTNNGWLDIASAPKTGRTLLLGYWNSHGKWRTVRGQWVSADHIAESFEEPDDAEEGWFETSAEADDVPNCWPVTPTHWQPMPAAPGSPASTVADEGAKDDEPEILPYAVQRILAFTGKHQSQCTAPHLSAQQAIDLAAWIQANCRPAPAAGDARDAARYRWLRDKSVVSMGHASFGLFSTHKRDSDFLSREEGIQALDDAIDAAVAASQQGGE